MGFSRRRITSRLFHRKKIRHLDLQRIHASRGNLRNLARGSTQTTVEGRALCPGFPSPIDPLRPLSVSPFDRKFEPLGFPTVYFSLSLPGRTRLFGHVSGACRTRACHVPGLDPVPGGRCEAGRERRWERRG